MMMVKENVTNSNNDMFLPQQQETEEEEEDELATEVEHVQQKQRPGINFLRSRKRDSDETRGVSSERRQSRRRLTFQKFIYRG